MALSLKSTQTTSPAETVMAFRVSGFGAIRADACHLASVRRQPGACAGRALSPAFLRHADDQTVAAVAVMIRTISEAGWSKRSFGDWGVAAAPLLFSRSGSALALGRFLSEGAWGVSPHMIPHHSLHAVSGTISQAMQLHGPNVGVGGGPGAAAEALLVAATMLTDSELPGLWVVLTGHEPELVPRRDDGPMQPTDCLAVALALQRTGPGECQATLHIGNDNWAAGDSVSPTFSLGAFVTHLQRGPDGAAGRWRLACGGWTEWEWNSGQQAH